MTEWFNGLSDRARRGIFGALAALVLAVGGWTATADHHNQAPTPGTAPTPHSAPATATPSETTSTSTPSTTAPAPSSAALQMPVSAADLQAAAVVANQFAQVWLADRFDADPAARAAQIAAFLSPDSLVDATAHDDLSPAQQQQIETTQRVITAVPQVTSVALVAPGMVTLSMSAVTTTTTANAAPATATITFAVTLVRDTGAWGVHDVDLDSAVVEA